MNTPRLNATSKRIAEDRYFNEDEKSAIVDDNIDAAYARMCDRVAESVAAAEILDKNKVKYGTIFSELLYAQDMIPAGRFWANAGGVNAQFPNCFIYPIYDSKESIFYTLKLSAFTFSAGGGIGFDFSRLRSRGIPTSTSKGTSSGPVSFLKLYDAMADTIVQGGTRRAATMGILRVDHPDILEFIFLKDKTQKYRRFNVSVAITAKFMTALADNPDKPWIVTDPKTQKDYVIFIPCEDAACKEEKRVVSFLTAHKKGAENTPNYMFRELHDVNAPKTGEKGFYITAPDVWDCIAYNAWNCGDPGIFFIDTANTYNCLIENIHDIENPYYIHATNPCGEEAMEDNAICMLTSINLANFVIKEDFHKHASLIDYKRLATVAKTAVRFLDNALDTSTYPTEDIRQHALSTRRIGVGVMGWADMLIKLRNKYGTEDSLRLATEVMRVINLAALDESIALGKEKGSFPLFNKSCYADGRNGFPKLQHLRNAYRTMIAPTGTTSLLTGVNESIEPIFNFYYERKDETGVHTVVNYLYQQWKAGGGKNIPDYFVTTNDISYIQHIDMQAAFQKNVDVSISKTINMPSSVSIDDIKRAYLYAYRKRCKGITVYRDKSKDSQVLNAPTSSSTSIPPDFSIHRAEGVLAGLTWKVKTGDGTCFISINKNGEGLPVEVFIRVGKAGSDINAYSEALGRIISIALQHSIEPKVITKQLIGILGDSPVFHSIGQYHKVLSVPDAVGKVLEDFLIKASNVKYKESSPTYTKKKDNSAIDVAVMLSSSYCSECQQIIRETEGCRTCGCGSVCDD